MSALRAAITAKVSAIAGIGVVHGHERYIKDQATLRSLYVSAFAEGDRLQGWYVSWRAMSPSAPDERRDVWALVGYRAVDDAHDSETGFASLADSVIDAFRSYEALELPGVSTFGEGLNGPSLKTMDHVMFCGVLCHRIEIELITARFTAVQGQ